MSDRADARTNRLAPFTDAYGVRHVWDHERAAWSRPDLAALDVVPTAVVETRLVESDLGRRYRTGHDLPATTGRGYPVYLRPHRVRVLYRRDVRTLYWVVTQVIVIGRPVLALIRHEYDGGPLPSERQRTFTDLDVMPSWVRDVARELATVEVD